MKEITLTKNQDGIYESSWKGKLLGLCDNAKGFYRKHQDKIDTLLGFMLWCALFSYIPTVACLLFAICGLVVMYYDIHDLKKPWN